MADYPDLPRWIEANAQSDTGMVFVILLALASVTLLLVVRFKFPRRLDTVRVGLLAGFYIATLLLLLRGV